MRALPLALLAVLSPNLSCAFLPGAPLPPSCMEARIRNLLRPAQTLRAAPAGCRRGATGPRTRSLLSCLSTRMAGDFEEYASKRGTFEPQVGQRRMASTGLTPWPNYYCASELDRQQRSEKALKAAPDSADSRYALVHKGQNLVRRSGDDASGQFEAVFLTAQEAGAWLQDAGSVVVALGKENGKDYYALDVSHMEEPPPMSGGEEFVQLRSVGGVLTRDLDAGLLAAARGTTVWHRSLKFCSRCGSGDLGPHRAGTGRKCGGCGQSFYPRVDPSVIVLVESPEGSHALLGRKETWPPGQYSTLAGFTEIAESLEETLLREVHEESGVRVARESIRYASSQPWPFPRSLMVGFFAVAEGQGLPAIAVDEEEMDDVRWFSREEVLRALRGQAGPADVLQKVPGKAAVAHRLIAGWVGEGADA